MSSVNEAISTLVTEVFQGTPPGADGTWFVQGNEALDVTLDALSAEEASLQLGPGINSIAAHTIHTAYYLELTNASNRDEPVSADWPGSWKRQQVDHAEWEAAKTNLRKQAAEFFEAVKWIDLADEDECTGAIAAMAHCGYHLGAIRQLYLMVKARQQ